MTLRNALDSPCWYVLNHVGTNGRDTAQKAVDKFNSANNTALELFAPTYVAKEERDGEIKFRTLSLTFHYTFVRGTYEQVKALCAQQNGFSFLIDRSSTDRYAVIDDRRMTSFQNIARAYKNCLPYYSIEDIDLEDGDLVEVVRGDFPGLIGTYIPKPKTAMGNIVLNIYNNVGTIAFNVKATDVRVLEFSRKNTRANDQIDAFVPHLLKALRLHDCGEPITTALAAKLAVFCGRMEVAKLDNRKLDARLQTLLYTANSIIGNNAEAVVHLERYEKLHDSVTNPWTVALISLLLSVASGNKTALPEVYKHISSLEADSRAKQMIADEYRYYLTSCQ